MTLVVERKPGSWVKDWDSLIKTAPNLNAHTVGEIIKGALTPEEASRFESSLRPVVDQQRAVMESAFAYLLAR